jgi:chromosome segregation ATPase
MRNYKNFNTNKKPVDTDKNKQQVTRDYSYYSRVLKAPFDSIDELKKAEAAYYAEIKAKEDKAATKKADAIKVEDAFKALNAARKDYKDNILATTQQYSENLAALKKSFEAAKEAEKKALADAEEQYANALKAFTDKYPEGYHLTLKDGDFETTISGKSNKTVAQKDAYDSLDEIFRWIFG